MRFLEVRIQEEFFGQQNFWRVYHPLDPKFAVSLNSGSVFHSPPHPYSPLHFPRHLRQLLSTVHRRCLRSSQSLPRFSQPLHPVLTRSRAIVATQGIPTSLALLL